MKANEVPQAWKLLRGGLNRVADTRFRNEDHLLIQDEARVQAPCHNEELTVIVRWDIARAHDVNLRAGRAKDGLRYGHVAGMQGHTPHPHQDPESERATAGQRGPPLRPPDEREERPHRRGGEDPVMIRAVVEAHNEVLRIMTTDVDLLSEYAETVVQVPTHHRR